VGNQILGSPIFQMPITLQDSSTTVSFGLDSKLTASIAMNGGSIYLLKDLKLKDDVSITGSGTVYFNGYSLVFPVYKAGPPITSNLSFVDANDVTVNSRTALTGSWSFTGTSNLKGTGVILDLTGGGILNIKNGATLYMNGLHIKGLGATGGGNITFGNSSSTVYMTECILELNGTFTQTGGIMITEGAFCKVITNSSSKYVVSGVGAEFRVNGQELQYENVSQLPTYPFQTVSSGLITTLNGGSISSNYIPSTPVNLAVYASSAGGAVNSTDANINLSSGTTLTFYNENPTVAKSMIFDGNYNIVEFGDGTNQPLVVQPYITLTIRNVKFKNFDPAKILLMGSGGSLAKLVFADNVIFDIQKDVSLATGALSLTGNTVISGRSNATLNMASQSITFTGASKLLTLRGLNLKYTAFDALKSLTDTSTVLFQASDIFMTNTGITIDKGYVQIKDKVTVWGASETTPDATTQLTFSSKGLLTVLTGSNLQFNVDTGFYYMPNVSGDGGVASVQKRHFKLADPSAILWLTRANVNTGSIGMAFDYGKIVIDDATNFKTSYTASTELEMGSSVNLTILQGAMLNVDGLLKYIPTTYP
jgi:hypothetical protein